MAQKLLRKQCLQKGCRGLVFCSVCSLEAVHGADLPVQSFITRKWSYV